MSDSVLSLRDFTVSFPTLYGTVRAVRGLSLDVNPGEFVGVVGESGSGKSVTFLGMMGLLPKSAIVGGSAKINGEELVGASNRKMRSVRGQKISMIFQDPLSALNPVHRIGAQIEEMLGAHQSLSRQESERRVIELLDIVGIPQPDQRARQFPHEFSGGMRQRVMIAMAIANNPELLIADEPTTALDVTVQAQILEVLERIRQELDTAIVLITHDLGIVARVVDRVEVMYAGRAVERATVANLFDTPSHPYTVGLMRSLPALGRERLEPIPGSPPNMLEPPPGCAFAPRCAHAQAACSAEIPDLREGRSGLTACIRSHELQLEVGTRG